MEIIFCPTFLPTNIHCQSRIASRNQCDLYLTTKANKCVEVLNEEDEILKMKEEEKTQTWISWYYLAGNLFITKLYFIFCVCVWAQSNIIVLSCQEPPNPSSISLSGLLTNCSQRLLWMHVSTYSIRPELCEGQIKFELNKAKTLNRKAQ